MTEEKLAFLDQPRDDAGRFASKSEDSQPAPVTPEPPVSEPPAVTQPVQEALAEPTLSQPSSAPVQPPPGYIPIAAVLDEREKRQKFERELEEYKRREAEAQRKPPQPLDPIADPEAFERQLNERIERVRWDAITNASLVAAVRHHGQEKVKAAEEWLQQELQSNPALWQTIQRQPDPYDFVVERHLETLKQKKLNGKDPDDYAQEWVLANRDKVINELLKLQAHGGAATPSPQPTLPRPSLASAPSAGGKAPNVPVGPGEAFNAVFK